MIENEAPVKNQREGDDDGDVFAHLLVIGKVQGVGFRAFSLACARALQVTGCVRNLRDGRVELEVKGARAKIEDLILQLHQGSPRSEVLDLEVSWGSTQTDYEHFSIAD